MQHTQQVYLAGVDWTGGITSMWNSFTTWVPRFVGFLIVLLIGWMIARVIGKAVESVLRRAHFERVMERAGMARTLENSKYDGSKLVGMIAYYLMLLIVLQLAFGVFGSNPINNVLHSILAWIPRGLVAVAIIVIAAMIARAVRDLVANMLSSLSYGRMLGSAAAVCIIALGVFAALGQAGIATSVSGPVLTAILATIAGVVIVGVGGGMIRPMQQRWERMLAGAEREAGHMVGAAQSSGMVSASGSGRMAGSGEAYAAGHSDAAQAAEEEARRARQNPMTGSGGGMGEDTDA